MTVTHLHGSVHASTIVETWADPFAITGAGKSAGTAPREYEVREWLSDWAQVPAFAQVIPSWTATTPQGTWIEVAVRVRAGAEAAAPAAEGPADAVSAAPGEPSQPQAGPVSSDWGIVARWSTGIEYAPAGGAPDWHSHSVNGQQLTGLRADADTLDVATDFLGGPASAVQARVRLFRPAPSASQSSAPANPELSPWPEVTCVSVLTRPFAGNASAGSAAAGNTAAGSVTASVASEKGAGGGHTVGPSVPGPSVSLLLPQFSQRIQSSLPGMGAGDSWCSPTSLAMVEGFWQAAGDPKQFQTYAPDEPAAQVPAAVARVWDYAYDGAGNWAFNVSWLASLGFDAYLDSLSGLDELAAILAAGEPVIASVRFTRADLPEAGYETGGHLLVVSGIDTSGDVEVHDPAARTNDQVRRTYPRAAFARAWLGGSGGLVYRVRAGKPADDR